MGEKVVKCVCVIVCWVSGEGDVGCSENRQISPCASANVWHQFSMTSFITSCLPSWALLKYLRRFWLLIIAERGRKGAAPVEGKRNAPDWDLLLFMRLLCLTSIEKDGRQTTNR